MKKLTIILLVIAVVLLGVITLNQFTQETQEPLFTLGGDSGPSNHTFTPTAGDAGQVLKTRNGILNRVTLTGAGAGSLALYNATTTNVNLRALATSSLPVIAQFPNATVAGTYEFNTGFTDGLVAEFTGAIGTSTIMWD